MCPSTDVMSFVSRLPAGHEILSMKSADLLKPLNDDGRVAGGVPSALADRKEWAAALAWVDSSKPVLMARSRGGGGIAGC